MKRAQRWESIMATVQGIGALILAWFTYDSLETGGVVNGRLVYGELWSAGLAVGGIGALLAAWPRLRTEWTWTVTGAVLSTSMTGRGLDILSRVETYSGRPELAAAMWIVMGISTATAWLIVGAATEAIETG